MKITKHKGGQGDVLEVLERETRGSKGVSKGLVRCRRLERSVEDER
jgi:hypothetical protein